MSLGAELLAEYEFERDYPFGLPGKVWHAKSGDIRLCDMTVQHIRNCMRVVGEDDAWYGEFHEELERRGLK